ncbi:MAG: HEAT repeat domain-containing protein [Anaerolineae bacterium]|nr:HEAT repeat domain-containing protein [Anaerolineae bacterium]
MPTYAEMQLNLKHSDPAVRMAAAQWLATCDFDRASLDLAQANRSEPDYQVRKVIRQAEYARADRLADERATAYSLLPDRAEALARALDDAADPDAAYQPAIDHLALRPEPEAFALLVRLLHAPDQDRREAAADALARRGEASALPHLLNLFTDPARAPQPDRDGDVSYVLVWSITRFGDCAVPYLLPYLENPTEAWRKRILWLLQELDEAATVQPLIDAYRRTMNVLAHHAIEAALRRINTPEARAFVESVRG